MTVKEAYEKGQSGIEAAKQEAQLLVAKAKYESWDACDGVRL